MWCIQVSRNFTHFTQDWISSPLSHLCLAEIEFMTLLWLHGPCSFSTRLEKLITLKARTSHLVTLRFWWSIRMSLFQSPQPLSYDAYTVRSLSGSQGAQLPAPPLIWGITYWSWFFEPNFVPYSEFSSRFLLDVYSCNPSPWVSPSHWTFKSETGTLFSSYEINGVTNG